MPQQTYEVCVVVESVRNIDVVAESKAVKLQVVWKGLDTKGQTAILPVQEGVVDFMQAWKIPKVTVKEECSLSLALWLYTEGTGEPTNIGMATVDISDFTHNHQQRHKFDVHTVHKILNQEKVELEFTMTTTPESHDSPQAPVQQSLPTFIAPKQGEPDAIPTYDQQDPSVSIVELREWTSDVLATVKDSIITATDQGDSPVKFSIQNDPTELDRIVMDILNEPVKRLASSSQTSLTHTQAVEESLISSTLEVYLRSTEVGSDIARLLRIETGKKLLSLMNLPETTQQRVYSDNGLATSSVLHSIQHTISQREKGNMKPITVYISPDTYAEWRETQVEQQIEWELPFLKLVPIPKGVDGDIDLTELENIIQKDSATSIPGAIVARMGSSMGRAGVDDLPALVGICQRYKVCLHIEGPAVFFFGVEGYAPCEPFRAFSSIDSHVSITLCADEVPGLRKIPGFWVFSNGPSNQPATPVDATLESNYLAVPSFLPLYLRLKGAGMARARTCLNQRLEEPLQLCDSLKEVNTSMQAHPETEGTTVCIKFHTSDQNRWITRFTIVPHGHPLLLHDANVLPEMALQGDEHLSIGQLNMLNTSIFESVEGPESDFTQFVDANGLLQWQSCIATSDRTPEMLQHVQETVMKLGSNMLKGVKGGKMMHKVLSTVPNIKITEILSRTPLELCCFRMVPAFCANKEVIQEADVQDMNCLNNEVLALLRQKGCADILFEGSQQQFTNTLDQTYSMRGIRCFLDGNKENDDLTEEVARGFKDMV
eukprot:TRINITY_DN17893_c0_g1_i1.p1 TRINITY_DN17893_c0_g1~~TRINITY_DN17893_c0_g1_i1.p1  ORF type:complete len:771 (+),score=208.19 TRINITY_DN17893_c0_g1_i1:35-2347(+)